MCSWICYNGREPQDRYHKIGITLRRPIRQILIRIPLHRIHITTLFQSLTELPVLPLEQLSLGLQAIL
jgi:hypothetical protein